MYFDNQRTIPHSVNEIALDLHRHVYPPQLLRSSNTLHTIYVEINKKQFLTLVYLRLALLVSRCLASSFQICSFSRMWFSRLAPRGS